MEKTLFFSMILLVASVRGQGPSFYFPDQPQPSSSQGPRSTQEVLGNFFNDNVNLPSITTSQPAYSSPQPSSQFQPYQPQTYSTGQPPQFGRGFPNQNYVSSSPVSNNRPRQTSFFGNNYDFFRQFHLDAAPHRPSYHQSQPYQTSSPSFSSNGKSQQTSTTAAASPTASSSFSSTQFFGSPFPTSPSRPAPTVTYNFINGQPAQNSLYNGYEEAAKALGITHGLRVFTTETLKANPTIAVATIPSQQQAQEIVTSPPQPAPVDDKRIEDDALTLTPSSTLSPSPPPTTTTLRPSPSTTSVQPVIIRNTGRSVATPVVRSRIVTTTPTPAPTSRSTAATTQSTPNVVVVTHSRQPLYTSSGVDAFPGKLEDDFEAAAPQAPRNVIPTTRIPPQPTKARTISPPLPPPPSPFPTFSAERPLYNNANRLNPGQLYTNTNGAYQTYYVPSEPPTGGLEEIVPQIIDFNVPIHKMIPMLEEHIPFRNQEFDPYRRPHSFNNFGPPPAGPPSFSQPQQQSRPFIPVAPQPSPQSPIAMIVTEIAPSPTPATEGPVEVLRVGPKGRLLKKRRKVKPQPQQQRTAAATTSEAVRPTTYRPPIQDNEDQHKQPVTTYRSRFRFSTTTSTPTSPPSPVEGATADGADSSQLIQSRLKSLERQIRFRHRNKNS